MSEEDEELGVWAERSTGPGAIAAWDQVVAEAGDLIRTAKAFFLVAMDAKGTTMTEVLVAHDPDIEEKTLDDWTERLLQASHEELVNAVERFRSERGET